MFSMRKIAITNTATGVVITLSRRTGLFFLFFKQPYQSLVAVVFVFSCDNNKEYGTVKEKVILLTIIIIFFIYRGPTTWKITHK